jgi:SAM-dependent methyltransferase
VNTVITKQELTDKARLFLGFARRLAAHMAVISTSPLLCHGRLRTHFKGVTALEIGGPSKVFRRFGLLPVYPLAACVDNCNFASSTMWEGEIPTGATFKFSKGRAAGQQYVAEASDLSFIPSSSYDLVLSSHTLEHVANPLLALREWIRVLREHGLLVLVLPHRDGTFDHKRPVTTLAHLIDDFERKAGEGDLTHLDEILRLHDLARDPRAGDLAAFERRSRKNIENRCLHHHVFDTRLAVEVIHHVGLQILTVELARPYHIFVIARKPAAGEPLDNESFRGARYPPVWNSPVPSDQQIPSPNREGGRHDIRWAFEMVNAADGTRI